MGSGDWFKTIISRKKGKDDKSKQRTVAPAPDKSSGSNSNNCSMRDTLDITNGASSETNGAVDILGEDLAAKRIQTAFRAYHARKCLSRLKGIVRLHKLAKGESMKKQSTSTLNHLHSWGRVQAQIRERRLCMVVEGRLKQKKLENQLKLDAKLHDVEVEWCGGSEALEEILSKIHQREEAAVKRERALAYAFTHQWRPNCSQYQGIIASELGKAAWGWSWKERWVVAQPWEMRLPSHTISPKKGLSNRPTKADKNTNLRPQKSLPVKTKTSNGKGSTKARRLSFPGAEATGREKSTHELKSTGGKEQNGALA